MCALLSLRKSINIIYILHAPYKVEAVHLLHVYMVPSGCKPRKLPALGCGPLGMHGYVILATGICLRYCKPFGVCGAVNYLPPRLPACKKIQGSVSSCKPCNSPTFCMFYNIRNQCALANELCYSADSATHAFSNVLHVLLLL